MWLTVMADAGPLQTVHRRIRTVIASRVEGHSPSNFPITADCALTHNNTESDGSHVTVGRPGRTGWPILHQKIRYLNGDLYTERNGSAM